MTRLIPTLALACLVLSSAAQAQSCASSANQMELNACAYEDWQIADAALNEAYDSVMDVLKAQDGDLDADLRGGPEALREAQRAWITFRDKTCEAEGFAMRGGSAEPMVVGFCLGRLTRERTSHLYGMLEGYGG